MVFLLVADPIGLGMQTWGLQRLKLVKSGTDLAVLPAAAPSIFG
jgi:hypothetical protein